MADLEKRLVGFVGVTAQNWNDESLKAFLSESLDKDSLAQYGTGSAKSFGQLAKELCMGECQLLMDTKSNELVRYLLVGLLVVVFFFLREILCLTLRL